nr:hypothetical protein [Tanacetum cinerariifolium]
MVGLLDVHWSLNLTRFHLWISTYIQMIKSRCVAFNLFIVMRLWDKCINDFKTSAKVKTVNEDVRLQALLDGKKVIVNEASIRCDLRLDDAEGAGFSGAITTLFETMMVQAPKEVGKIPTDTQDTPILIQPSSSQPKKKQKSRRKQRKETEVPHIEPQTKESIPTPSNDPLPSDKAKIDQAKEIAALKKRVKKLKRKKKSRTSSLKRLYNISLSARIISSDVEDQMRMNEEDLFRVHDLNGDEVFVDITASENVDQDATVAKKEVSTTAEDIEVTTAATTLQIFKDDVTLAQTIIEIKAAKPRVRGVIVQDPKTKKPLKKEQIMIDEEVARQIEAEMKAKMEEEERIAREKEEANRAMIEE